MLLETLLAAAMLAGGVVVLINGLVAALRLTHVGRDRLAVGWRLEERMWAFEHTGHWSDGADESGEGTQWRMEEGPLDDGWFRRRFSASWGARERRHAMEVWTLQPPP